LFEQGAAAFENDEKREVAQLKKKVAKLESKVATKNEVMGELMEAHIALKKSWGRMTSSWQTAVIRDEVVDFVSEWAGKAMIGKQEMLKQIGVGTS
jgi:hypothetical protein